MEIDNQLLTEQSFGATPELAVRLLLPDGSWSPLLICVVDTGFGGDLVITSKLFNLWANSVERHPDDAEQAMTATGEKVQFRSVDSQVQIGEDQFTIVISSTPV